MNNLYHHGIKGQEWGVRNGPPYLLDRATKKKTNKARPISKPRKSSVHDEADQRS